MGMYDKERKYPVLDLVVHHSVSEESPQARRWSDQEVANYFSNIGKGRTYAGYSNSYHYDVRTGRETFSAVPLALWPNGDGQDIYSDTWRVIEIFPWLDNVGWHCGNWAMNCRSVGVETYGRYDNKNLPERAVYAMAQWCINNIEKHNQGKTFISGHKEIFPTACPGDWMNKKGLLIDMINNPSKYKATFEKHTEDPAMIDELKKQNNNLSTIIGQKDVEIINLRQIQQQEIQANIVLREENAKLKVDLSNLEQRFSKLETTLLALQADNASKTDTIANQEVVIRGLNEAMAKFKNDSSTVVMPHNKFEKIEKIFTGTHTWKEKIKSIVKDFGFALQNSAGGGIFTVGTFNVWLDAVSYFDKSVPFWINILVITAAFLIGYNTTKSVSKNMLTKNNFTVAKAYIAKTNPDRLDELEAVEKALSDKNLIQ